MGRHLSSILPFLFFFFHTPSAARLISVHRQIMLTPTFLSFALLTSALALPVQDVALSLDRRQSRPFNSSLPTIAILATGGTIAGSAASAGAATGYAAGSLGIDILLNAVPEMYFCLFHHRSRSAHVCLPLATTLPMSKGSNSLMCKSWSVHHLSYTD